MADGLQIKKHDVLDLIDVFSQVALRKIQLGSSFDSPCLYYLRPQYRPHLAIHEERTLENSLGDILLAQSGNRIGFFLIFRCALQNWHNAASTVPLHGVRF
ncbi:MAG: hypothetical protein ACRER8_08925 [Pseudomonas sp.]|uniref:hypothetical protein n=1 Tax=Pseudomonas sp. TaxID=306 RepID=UPI003D6FA9BC